MIDALLLGSEEALLMMLRMSLEQLEAINIHEDMKFSMFVYRLN